MITAKFGSKSFEATATKIYTPNGLSFSESLNIEEEEVDGKKPVVKIKGINLQTLSFEVNLDSRFVDIETEITWWSNKLKSLSPDYFSLGKYTIGRFYLVEVSKSDIQIANNGKMTKAKMSLSFKEVGGTAVKTSTSSSTSSTSSSKSTSKSTKVSEVKSSKVVGGSQSSGASNLSGGINKNHVNVRK